MSTGKLTQREAQRIEAEIHDKQDETQKLMSSSSPQELERIGLGNLGLAHTTIRNDYTGEGRSTKPGMSYSAPLSHTEGLPAGWHHHISKSSKTKGLSYWQGPITYIDSGYIFPRTQTEIVSIWDYPSKRRLEEEAEYLKLTTYKGKVMVIGKNEAKVAKIKQQADSRLRAKIKKRQKELEGKFQISKTKVEVPPRQYRTGDYKKKFHLEYEPGDIQLKQQTGQVEEGGKSFFGNRYKLFPRAPLHRQQPSAIFTDSGEKGTTKKTIPGDMMVGGKRRRKKKTRKTRKRKKRKTKKKRRRKKKTRKKRGGSPLPPVPYKELKLTHPMLVRNNGDRVYDMKNKKNNQVQKVRITEKLERDGKKMIKFQRVRQVLDGSLGRPSVVSGRYEGYTPFGDHTGPWTYITPYDDVVLTKHISPAKTVALAAKGMFGGRRKKKTRKKRGGEKTPGDWIKYNEILPTDKCIFCNNLLRYPRSPEKTAYFMNCKCVAHTECLRNFCEAHHNDLPPCPGVIGKDGEGEIQCGREIWESCMEVDEYLKAINGEESVIHQDDDILANPSKYWRLAKDVGNAPIPGGARRHKKRTRRR